MTHGRTIRRATLKVGLEIHVELATRAKMFSRAANVAHPDHFDAQPNTLLDPVVLGLPGALPVMNRRAVEMAMMVGLALNCRINGLTRWDRKSYFYPDLPKGYQISQYDLPLCADGWFDVPVEESGLGNSGDAVPATLRPAAPLRESLHAEAQRGAEARSGGVEYSDPRAKRIRIIRAHLEEDAGKLGHELPGGHPFEGTLVDLNRAGTPLLEIVTAPDFSSVSQVEWFARELRRLCRFLGVTEGIMQRGHMRFEPNINVLIEDGDGAIHATPIVEVKNLNSFRSLVAAIEHEFARQQEEWLETGRTTAVGEKTTRGWDDVRLVTVLQREKEEAHDYRYFPDPDLVPVIVDEEWRRRVEASMSELPLRRLARYLDEYGLSRLDAMQLIEEPGTSDLFERCVVACGLKSPQAASHRPQAAFAKAVANLILQTAAKHANARGIAISELPVASEQIVGIIALREANRIGSSAVDELFAALCETDRRAEDVAEEKGLIQVTDTAALERWVDEAIAANPKAVESVRAGQMKAMGAIVGAVMKVSGGKADARAVSEVVRQRLG